MTAEGEPVSENEEPMQELFDVAEEDLIENRTSEAEKLYANLLMKTDFERDFIEDMLEFEPGEESEMRIEELRQKRKQLQEMPEASLSPSAPQGSTTILI